MLARRQAISIETAFSKIAALNVVPKIEEIPLSVALGRRLATELTAPQPLPAFRRSGYDGFAIRKADDGPYPRDFKVVGDVPAGATYDQPLQPGETVRIMTGACVPAGGHKIVMLEQTRGDADQITILTPTKNTNITEIGTEFMTGDILLPKHTTLNAGAISLLAAFDMQTVPVYAQPKVGIISTGSELLTAGEDPTPGKIYNSNGPLLAALVSEIGGQVVTQVAIPDNYPLLQKTLADLIPKCDVILTTGGVSVGDYDFLALVAKDDAQELLFNKLKMRPGSVTTAFLADDTPIMALSGNPGACFTAFHLFVAPLLQRFNGIETTERTITAIMDQPYTKTNGYDRILRGELTYQAGQAYVHLVGSDQSGALGNLHQTNCLFKIPHSQTPIQLNAEVTVWPLSYK